MNLQPTARLLGYFKDYESSHSTDGNRKLHWIGIPLVMFSLLGLLSKVVLLNLATPTDDGPIWSILFGQIDLGLVLVFIGLVWSIWVDAKIGIPFVLFSYAQYLYARELDLNLLIALQIIAWVFQLAGHAIYEKKKPKFLENITHLFVGPTWKFALLFGYYKPQD
jgi:uncharacterized membrane protein YGL010W